MSNSTWLTLRLVGVGILFLPTFCDLLDFFLPKVLADLIGVVISIVIALFVNDWLFQERNFKRLLKTFRIFK
jgi:putative flippase GtrA